MTNGQFANFLKMLIFKMSDSGSKKLNDFFSPQGEYVRDKAVREFSYLKGFLVECLCRNASTQKGDADMVMGLVVQLLGESWERWRDSNYGCNVPEMLSRFSEYRQCYDDIMVRHNFDSITNLFIKNIGEDYVKKSHMSFEHMAVFVSDTFDSLQSSIIKKTNGGGGGCYVATSVYGSYDCPEVWILRRFRDYILGENWIGQFFIYVYYKISPTLVKKFGEKVWFKNSCKYVLDKFISILQDKGLSNLPYHDKKW